MQGKTPGAQEPQCTWVHEDFEHRRTPGVRYGSRAAMHPRIGFMEYSVWGELVAAHLFKE
jgi:hypothetical protein